MKVLSLPTPSHIANMFAPDDWSALCAEFEVIENSTERQMTAAEVLARIGDCDAVITGWGSPAFSREALDAAPRLKLVAHTAGSVKGLFSDELVREVLIPRGINVYSGANGIALNVAEATIGLMILATRRWVEHSAAFSEKKRGGADFSRNAQFLTGATVGLVSASLVGRHVLRVLQPFECRILIYDPFLSPEAARSLGAELTDLDTLFERSDIVSLHAPKLPATDNMIGAAQLAKLRDGGVFVNTSRGSVVDHDALLAECRTGRIVAALDVTEPEPLPPDSEFWTLPNVILLPHIAGQGRAGYQRVGEMALRAMRDCFAGRPVAGAVALDRWETIA